LPQRIGILGGTFNPVHFGHLAAAEEVRDRLRLDRVLFIPAFLPPHKDEVLPSAVQRLEMVRLALATNPHFKASDIEIKRGGRSFTIDTIGDLQQLHPGAELYFITGIDAFIEVRTWMNWERLLSLCTFVVLSREGFRFGDLARLGFLDQAARDLAALDEGHAEQARTLIGDRSLVFERIPYYEISSTDIRARVRQGRSIKYCLPEAVEHYIIENKLYG
jgi:nicotinate-nucleotide adenylyltransferase